MKPNEFIRTCPVNPRAVVSRLLTVAVVSFALLASSNSADAGFFDKLKEKAEEAVQETLPDLDAEKRKVEKAVTEPLESKTSTGGSSNKSSASGSPLIDSVDYLMQRWPYKTPKGNSAKDIELRGVRLGQPFPDAHEALINGGFSYMRQDGRTYIYRMHYVEVGGERKWVPQSEYSEASRQPGFKSIRVLEMSIDAITPSEQIMAELPPYPAGMLQQSIQTRSAPASDTRRSRQSRVGRTAVSSRSTPRFPDKPLYVSGITYFQKFISGERVEWKALLQKAREQFGEPNYGLPDTQRAGDAYKTYEGSALWYLDSALMDPASIRKILATVEPDKPQSSLRQMVWKDMMHPGIFANVSYATQGFDDYAKAVDAMRVAGAPYLGISYKHGFRMDLKWPFLDYEASSRQIYERRQAKKAEPKADVKF